MARKIWKHHWTGLILTAFCIAWLVRPSPSEGGATRYNPEACYTALEQADVAFERVPNSAGKNGCKIVDGVSLERIGLAGFNKPAVLTCHMARLLVAFERNVLQPFAALELGAAITRLDHMGAYSCRYNGRALSQHAFANALDLSGFGLSDGRTVTVLDNWKDRNEDGLFLHRIARKSCDFFEVVLSPNYNADHRDHLHLDAGPQKRCGY